MIRQRDVLTELRKSPLSTIGLAMLLDGTRAQTLKTLIVLRDRGLVELHRDYWMLTEHGRGKAAA